MQLYSNSSYFDEDGKGLTIGFELNLEDNETIRRTNLQQIEKIAEE